MKGPDLGVQADDLDVGDAEYEPQQEVLENKDVRLALFIPEYRSTFIYCWISIYFIYFCSGCSSACTYRWAWKD